MGDRALRCGMRAIAHATILCVFAAFALAETQPLPAQQVSWIPADESVAFEQIESAAARAGRYEAKQVEHDIDAKLIDLLGEGTTEANQFLALKSTVGESKPAAKKGGKKEQSPPTPINRHPVTKKSAPAIKKKVPVATKKPSSPVSVIKLWHPHSIHLGHRVHRDLERAAQPWIVHHHPHEALPKKVVKKVVAKRAVKKQQMKKKLVHSAAKKVVKQAQGPPATAPAPKQATKQATSKKTKTKPAKVLVKPQKKKAVTPSVGASIVKDLKSG